MLPLRSLGKYGVVHDSQDQALPVGTWSDARNIRFSGLSFSKMLEPALEIGLDASGYACDAFESGVLSSGASNYWTMTEDHMTALPQGDHTPSIGSVNMVTAGGNHLGSAGTLIPDDCGDRTSWTVGSGLPYLELPADHLPWFGFAFTFVGALASTSAGSIYWAQGTNATFGNLVVHIESRAAPNYDFVVNYSPISGGPTQVFFDTDSWVLSEEAAYSFKINETTIEYWKNFELIQTLDISGTAAMKPVDTVDFIRPFNTSDHRVHHIITDGNFSILKDAWDRNDSSYVGGIIGIPNWFQGWSDGLSTYFVMGTGADPNVPGSASYLYFWKSGAEGEGLWEAAGGPYPEGSRWQGFEWGDTIIANNGATAPQIFNPGTIMFEDLPNWGILSDVADLTDNIHVGDEGFVGRDVGSRCTVILPYKNLLVALGVTESGLYRPNTVWWSDTTSLAGYNTGVEGTGGPPNWDYESPASASGKNEVGVGSGALQWGSELNENLICFTDASATAMQLTGGPSVMQFRRLFNKGCAGLYLAEEYNNSLMVVSRDQIYRTDGSSVQLIAKDRVEEEFYRRAGKAGRHGSVSSTINFETMQLVKNPDRKEIYLVFDSTAGTRDMLVYNFEDENYTWADASIDKVTSLLAVPFMAYAFNPGAQVRWSDLDEDGTTWEDLDTDGTTWADFSSHGTEENMYWLAADGVYRADQAVKTDGMKEYFVERQDIDLDDLNPQWTTNLYKHIKTFYPHIESPKPIGADPNPFEVIFGWSANLMDDPDYLPAVTVNLNNAANAGQHKADFRTTGRYLAMKMTFDATLEFYMSGGDIDASESHAR